MISCKGYNVNLETAVVAILVFCRMSHINSIQGLSGIKAISKCEVNPTSGFQDIAFTSKSRVSYHDPGFLFSATYPSMLKKHYNG